MRALDPPQSKERTGELCSRNEELTRSPHSSLHVSQTLRNRTIIRDIHENRVNVHAIVNQSVDCVFNERNGVQIVYYTLCPAILKSGRNGNWLFWCVN